VAAASWLFTLSTPAYATITSVCVILLYLSYTIPTALGAVAYGRRWRRMGPWNLGAGYRPLAAVSIAGSLGLVAIGVQPPNEHAVNVLAGIAATLALGWFCSERRRFAGPPVSLMDAEWQQPGDGPP
jgi:hypothetical protein